MKRRENLLEILVQSPFDHLTRLLTLEISFE
jgi:hypothetical protein